MWHVTVRMAWHDRGWDGAVCDDPAANTYCTGTNSLLSERIAREKRVASEIDLAGKSLDVGLPAYLPPCFWTSSAFAQHETKVLHRHPFRRFRDKKHILGSLKPFSSYTWPFRLSIAQSPKAEEKRKTITEQRQRAKDEAPLMPSLYTHSNFLFSEKSTGFSVKTQSERQTRL